jgi:flagellar biosynthesis/type III secretory pathway ATPase
MNIEQVDNAVDIAIHKLPRMEGLYKQARDETQKMQYTMQHFSNEVVVLNIKYQY